ncbi:MAG TPA: 4Fe-4S binding protein [Chitinispirillaceae bacterium]|nr:4Fe-4S binding protein [Chitinispirillaceae bacterium]
MRKIRIILQVIFVSLFLSAFFFLNTNPLAYTFDSEFFLRLNPFTGLISMIASRTVIMPLVIFSSILLISTILFGRFFCGFFCPLGTMIDFFDRFLYSRMRSNKRRPQIFLQRLKYVLLTIVVVLSVFGVLFPIFIDPLSLVTRFMALLIHPLANIMGQDILRLTSIFSSSFSNHLYSIHPFKIPLYYGTMLTLILAVIVFGGSFWDKRFWCQYVCPTGAFLGIMSRFSLFRRKTSESGCNSCLRCARSCPVQAIDEKDVTKTRVSECIECGICVQLKDNCSSFHLGLPSSQKRLSPDLHRRHLLSGVTGGLLMLPVFRATGISKNDNHGKLIRPPGTIPEEQFMARCLACGECMKVCPTNTLQPCMFTDGFSRLYTPKVVPRIAGCEEKCNLCGNVCPTGAIRKLPLEEKQFVKIGTAVLDHHRCLAWAQNKECLVCDEVCPYNAIEARVVETVKGRFKVPVVNEDLCIGCGMCEQHCPIFDIAAITVYKFGENRRLTGEYTTTWQKEKTRELRRNSDSAQLGKSITGIEEGDIQNNRSTPDSDPYGNGESSSGFSSGFE